MRAISVIALLVFLGTLLLFAVQNQHNVEIRFVNRSLMFPLAGLAVGAYILGMLSGWSVLGFLRKSLRRVHEEPGRS